MPNVFAMFKSKKKSNEPCLVVLENQIDTFLHEIKITVDKIKTPHVRIVDGLPELIKTKIEPLLTILDTSREIQDTSREIQNFRKEIQNFREEAKGIDDAIVSINNRLTEIYDKIKKINATPISINRQSEIPQISKDQTETEKEKKEKEKEKENFIKKIETYFTDKLKNIDIEMDILIFAYLGKIIAVLETPTTHLTTKQIHQILDREEENLKRENATNGQPATSSTEKKSQISTSVTNGQPTKIEDLDLSSFDKLKEFIAKIKTMDKEKDQEKINAAIALAIEALEKRKPNNGLSDSFYKAFESQGNAKQKQEEAEIQNASNNSMLKLLYFPSESSYFGEKGKVEKKNTYGNYAIVSSKPNTSFGTMAKKSFQTSEDFIAQLLQGRKGPVKRQPIFEEDILIKDQSEVTEIAKKHMKNKIQEINDIFYLFLDKPPTQDEDEDEDEGEEEPKIETKEERKKRFQQLENTLLSKKNKQDAETSIKGISDYFDELKKLHTFREEIREKLEKSDYSMVLPNPKTNITSGELYKMDKQIKELKKKLR